MFQGWKRREEGNKVTMKEIERVIEELKRELDKIYGNRLRKIVLYGSYARGDYTEDSDIDILIVLRGRVKPGQEIDRIIDAITDINLKYGVLISVYPISESKFRRLKSPLLINARREGVTL